MPLTLRMLPIIVALYQDLIFSKKLVLNGNIDIDRIKCVQGPEKSG